MPVLKKVRTKDFVQINRNLAQNMQLSHEAKGLLVEMLSYPENWKFKKSSFYRKNCRRVKIHRIFQELKTAGYLYLANIYEKGKIIDRIWVASSEPIFDLLVWKEQTKSLMSGNLTVRKPVIEEKLNVRKPYRKETLPKGNLTVRKPESKINNKYNIYIKNNNKIKNNIPKDCKEQDSSIKYTEDFEQFWAFYPKRATDNSKIAAFRNWKSLIKKGEKVDVLILAVKNYQIVCNQKNNIGTDFVFKASNFLGRNKLYQEFININLEELKNATITKQPRNTKQHETLKEIHRRACEEIEKDKR